jgi:hypothetical protein
MRKLLVLLSALALGGCVESQVIVLKNPANGAIIQCRAGTTGASFFPIIQTEIDNSSAQSCAKGYEAAGWQRMN